MRLLVILASLALLPATAATAQPIANLADAAPVAAQGGWVVWSTKVGEGWALDAWVDGVVRRLPVAARADPFDVDLGTDARGRAVATYSRCGERCRLRVLDLDSGRERAIRVPLARGASDRWPAMWRGRTAFSRRDARHGRIDQIRLWNPASRRLRTLPHGSVPTGCPYRGGCDREPPTEATATGLDLGRAVVAFLWSATGPAAYGHGQYEVRADRLSGGRGRLVAEGFAGEVCTGGTDGVFLSAPSVDGEDVLFARTQTECYRNTVDAVGFDSRSGSISTRRLDGNVLELISTAGHLVTLTAPPAGEEDPDCTASAPCVLERRAG